MPTPFASVLPCSPPFLPPVHLCGFSACLAAAMFFDHGEPDHFPCPVFETLLTPGETQDLSSLIQTEDPACPPSSGSQGSNQTDYSIEERKQRRKELNKNSARRSRLRKKIHSENLTNEASRLRIANRELKNQLGLLMHQHLLLSIENNLLTSESVALLGRLSDLCCILGAMHSQ